MSRGTGTAGASVMVEPYDTSYGTKAIKLTTQAGERAATQAGQARPRALAPLVQEVKFQQL